MRRKSQQQSLIAGPPPELLPSERIAKVDVINGNNVYTVSLSSDGPLTAGPKPKGNEVLVELPSKFRNSMWIRRGGFVLVNCAAFQDRENKLAGEIVFVIHDEKSWMKMHYWPYQFRKQKIQSTILDIDDSDDLSAEGNLNIRKRDSDDED